MTASTTASTVVQQLYTPDLVPGEAGLFRPSQQGFIQYGTNQPLCDAQSGDVVYEIVVSYIGAKIDYIEKHNMHKLLVELDLDGYKFTLTSEATSQSAISHMVSIAVLHQADLQSKPFKLRLVPGYSQRSDVCFLNYYVRNPRTGYWLTSPLKDAALSADLRSHCTHQVMSKLLIDHDAQLLGSGVTATDLLLLSQG